MIALTKGYVAIRHQADFKEYTTYQFTDVKALLASVKLFVINKTFISILYIIFSCYQYTYIHAA